MGTSIYTTNIKKITTELDDFLKEVTKAGNEVYSNNTYIQYDHWSLIDIEAVYATQPPYYLTFQNPLHDPYAEIYAKADGAAQTVRQNQIPHYRLDHWILYVQSGFDSFRKEHKRCLQWLSTLPPMPPGFVPGSTGSNVYWFSFNVPPIPEYYYIVQAELPAGPSSFGACCWEPPSDVLHGLIEEQPNQRFLLAGKMAIKNPQNPLLVKHAGFPAKKGPKKGHP